jgi:hypothetical protein
MGDIYNDKARHDNFQQRQDDIENSIQSSAENYSNEVLQSKLADVQNKTIGSELMFSSIPASFAKATETYSRVKGLYQKIQALPEKVSSVIEDTKAKAGGLLEEAKSQLGMSSDVGDIGKGSKVFENPLFDEGAEETPQRTAEEFESSPTRGELFGEEIESDPVAETFGSVKSYLGGQVGNLGEKVAVLPNAETSVGSLKQAIPKPQDIQDVSSVKSTVGDVAGDVAGKVAGDVTGDVVKSGATELAAEGTSILAEAAVPIVGDIAALGSLAYGAFEGIKDLFDKPKPPPVPTVNVQAAGVNQAGI